MIRDGDRKISLRRRVALARDADAEAFLSIHADRVDEPWVRGVSVYTLSAEASDLETAELAARENRADIVVDVDLSEGYDEDTAKVLISLVQQNTMNCSVALAAHLLPELGPRGRRWSSALTGSAISASSRHRTSHRSWSSWASCPTPRTWSGCGAGATGARSRARSSGRSTASSASPAESLAPEGSRARKKSPRPSRSRL